MRSAVAKFVVVASFTACALDFSMTPRDASVDGGNEDGGDDVAAGDAVVPDAHLDEDGGNPFFDPLRWEVFDLRSVDTGAGVDEAGVSPRGAAVFDGRGLWVFPSSGTNIAYRYEVDGDFKDASSWSPVRTQAGSSAAYCVDDGHIYLASYDGRDPIVRYRAASFPSGTFSRVTDGGLQEDGFSGTSCFPMTGFYAAAADPRGDSFYKGPDAQARGLPGPYRGVAHYKDSAGTDRFFFVPAAATQRVLVFADAGSWAPDAGIALTALDFPAADTFEGAIDDGKFVYIVRGFSPGDHIHRFRESESFADASSWEKSPLLRPLRAHGGVFDGRYVYFAPGGTSSFLVYDTDASFSESASWNEINLTKLDAGALYRGAAFDGRYVYFIPAGEPVIVRYKTDATGMPPTHTGSFY